MDLSSSYLTLDPRGISMTAGFCVEFGELVKEDVVG